MFINKSIAIGYVRVSSSMQAKDQSALARQEYKLRQSAEKNGYLLDKVLCEIASAAPDNQMEGRNVLLRAVSEVKLHNATLFITEPTRLFRNEEVAREFLAANDIPIFSVNVGHLVSSDEILKAVHRGAENAENIRAGTVKALALGARVLHPDFKQFGAMGRAKSLLTQKAKKDALNNRIIKLMRDHPGSSAYTHQEFSDWLNKLDVSTSQGKLWNKALIAKKRREIEELIEITGRQHLCDERLMHSSAVKLGSFVDIEEEDELHKHPLFGLF